jgi:hypothetical protein
MLTLPAEKGRVGRSGKEKLKRSFRPCLGSFPESVVLNLSREHNTFLPGMWPL